MASKRLLVCHATIHSLGRKALSRPPEVEVEVEVAATVAATVAKS
jgi:hypothetical protein